MSIILFSDSGDSSDSSPSLSWSDSSVVDSLSHPSLTENVSDNKPTDFSYSSETSDTCQSVSSVTSKSVGSKPTKRDVYTSTDDISDSVLRPLHDPDPKENMLTKINVPVQVHAEQDRYEEYLPYDISHTVAEPNLVELESRRFVESHVEGMGNIVDWDLDEDILIGDSTDIPKESTPVNSLDKELDMSIEMSPIVQKLVSISLATNQINLYNMLKELMEHN